MEKSNDMIKQSETHEELSQQPAVDKDAPSQEEEIPQEEESRQQDQSSKKPKRKLSLDLFAPLSLKILADLVTYVNANPNSDLFGDHVFVQPVKSKNKQTDTYLIESENFFEVLELFGIVNIPIKASQKEELAKAKENLQALLCIDEKYPNLLLIKRINQSVSLLSADEGEYEKAKRYTYAVGVESPLPNPNAKQDTEEDEQEEKDETYEEEFIDDEDIPDPKSDSNPVMDESLPKEEEYGTTFEEGKLPSQL